MFMLMSCLPGSTWNAGNRKRDDGALPFFTLEEERKKRGMQAGRKMPAYSAVAGSIVEEASKNRGRGGGGES